MGLIIKSNTKNQMRQTRSLAICIRQNVAHHLNKCCFGTQALQQNSNIVAVVQALQTLII